MLLREFLYADSDKVRSLMGQLSDGIPEESKETQSSGRQTTAGMKSIASLSGDHKTEMQVSKSLTDSIFGQLEEILEAEGWLVDISDDLAQGADLTDLPEMYPPGTFIRITSVGHLFDARYIARVLSGVAATLEGMQLLPIQGQPAVKPPSGKKATPRHPKRSSDEGTLEAEIREFDPELLGGFTAENLKSFVKISRGVLSPGVHLMLTPRGDEIAISARLQEGRQYLETDAEILFSRYGITPQEWTLVGSIGAYAPQVDVNKLMKTEFTIDGERINRSRLANFVNEFVQFMGHQGFADLPQFPGFSVVPLAVYRVIPTINSKEVSVSGAVL